MFRLAFTFHSELLSTEAVIIYSPSSISIGLLLAAGSVLKLPLLSDDQILKKVNKQQHQYENVDDQDILPWWKKISADADIKEI